METSHSAKLNLVDRLFAALDRLGAGDRLFLGLVVTVFLCSLGWLLWSLNAAALVSIPGRGGSLVEGVIGTPRFANPVLAVSGADQDLTALVYSGLMKRGADGTLRPDLAESVTISDDGLIYSIVLRGDVSFHDGSPLSVEDVLFTIGRVQDPALKSPLLASWDGVVAERLGEHELNIVLPEPYAPFLENLTLGILPKHIWDAASSDAFPFSQFNTEPIGTGPYRIESIERNRSGIPESYKLVTHDDYHGNAPRIDTLVLRFFATEDALANAFLKGDIESAGGLSPETLAQLRAAQVPLTEYRTPLPRTFALFFNQNELPLLRDAAVREALTLAVDRDELVREALDGYGAAVAGPLPPDAALSDTESAAQLEEARDVLRAGGWRLNETSGMWERTVDETTTPLTFSIATANTPVFAETATLLAAQWERLGVPVTIRQFEQPDLTTTVIRPRAFETLLFGTVVGRERDLYSFWHSSQRNDPGLNVALYTNLTVDALLAEARTTADVDRREELFERFATEIANDTPAVFLYTPLYAYVTRSNLTGLSLTNIARGADRFSTVADWSVEQESVWHFFAE